jgi:hypothetical protein
MILPRSHSRLKPRTAKVPNQGFQALPPLHWPLDQPQSALTHQTPGGGTGSTGTPTSPMHPPGCCLGSWWLSEPGPGAGARVRLGDYPQSACQQLLPHCPARHRHQALGQRPGLYTSLGGPSMDPFPTLHGGFGAYSEGMG